MIVNALELNFNEIPPSVNVYMRWHWTKRKNVTEMWHWLVKAALKGEKPQFKHPVVRSEYYFTDNRERDTGNYIPKFAIDALVKEGVITGDSCKHIKEMMPEIYLKQSKKQFKLIIEEGENENK